MLGLIPALDEISFGGARDLRAEQKRSYHLHLNVYALGFMKVCDFIKLLLS
jgi:hypothetical protein